MVGGQIVSTVQTISDAGLGKAFAARGQARTLPHYPLVLPRLLNWIFFWGTKFWFGTWIVGEGVPR